eukprot:COSAG06_NODE_4424_length_4280_cov_6.770390_4_plen_28_part_01
MQYTMVKEKVAWFKVKNGLFEPFIYKND